MAAAAAAASPRLVFTQTLTQQDRFAAPASYLCGANPDGANQSCASASAYPFLLQADYSRDGSHVTL